MGVSLTCMNVLKDALSDPGRKPVEWMSFSEDPLLFIYQALAPKGVSTWADTRDIIIPQ